MPTTTTTAVPSLVLDGTEITERDLSLLIVTQSINAAAHAKLHLHKPDEWVEKYKVGSKLVVKAPDGLDKVVVFSGVIQSVGLDWRARGAELIVDAYDNSHKLAQKTVVKNYKDQTAADIVKAIAGTCGLQAKITGPMTTVVIPHVQQYGTNHQMITELVHAAGCEWWMEDTTIVVQPRPSAGSPVVTLNGQEELRRFSARFSGLDRTKNVTVRGWDTKTKKVVVGTAPGVNNGAPANPPITTMGDQPQGEAISWPKTVAVTENATAVAKGIAARMGATLLSARGEAYVAPKVRPGAVVQIGEVSTKWNGNYYITEVEHFYNYEEGFLTRFVAGGSDDESIAGLIGRQDRHNGAQFTNGLTIGIVTNNNDDGSDGYGGLNRVKVKLPYLSDSDESTWARLVLPGAGNARGLMVLPEIDDEVLVGFENGDMRRPYVLGGLWNGKDLPPLNTSSGKVVNNSKVTLRSFMTRKGHHLSIVDGGSDADDMIILTLQDEVAELVLAHDSVSLLHSGDVPLSVTTKKAAFEIAKGGDVKVTGTNITVEAQGTLTLKATNVKIDAKANVDIKAGASGTFKGTGGVEIDGSPGLAVVKGSMVNVN